jgi:hypothetical protein
MMMDVIWDMTMAMIFTLIELVIVELIIFFGGFSLSQTQLHTIS